MVWSFFWILGFFRVSNQRAFEKLWKRVQNLEFSHVFWKINRELSSEMPFQVQALWRPHLFGKIKRELSCDRPLQAQAPYLMGSSFRHACGASSFRNDRKTRGFCTRQPSRQGSFGLIFLWPRRLAFEEKHDLCLSQRVHANFQKKWRSVWNSISDAFFKTELPCHFPLLQRQQKHPPSMDSADPSRP